MSPFELSPAVENLKVFFTNFSDLDGRYDPEFYRSREKLIKNFFYPLDKISNSFFIKDGDHDKLPVDAISDELEGKRYLRSQDLKNNEIISANPVYVSSEYFKKMSRCHIYAGDLLFSIMASVGATAIVPNGFPSCMANRAVGILRPKKYSRFLPEYVQVLFNSNVGMALINIQKRGGIQQRINLADIGQLRLPVPDKNTQKKIIDIYSNALNLKKEKEVASQSLLDSIDTYLLNELGITLPEQDNSFGNRLFFVSSRDVFGRRFDAKFNAPDRIEFYSKLKKSSYIRSLGSIIVEASYGVLPPGDSYDNKNPIMFIRATDLKEELQIDFSNTYFVKQEYFTSRAALKKNDILLAVKGATIASNKSVALVTEDKSNTIINGSILRMQVNEEALPEYVACLLSSKILKIQMKNNLVANNAVDYLDKKLVFNLLLPLPEITHQIKIFKHIQAIRQQAAELRGEGAQILIDAKMQVERMILGESMT